ncbi:MAG TPA: ATP-binding cassette domain-containing protein [Streptosporangiaceae bacterium]|nr:ATP-binding cassette domain-containing protein [Streptosporangiaceae bacterium]
MTIVEARGLRRQFTLRVPAGRTGATRRWPRRDKRVVDAVDGIDLTVEHGESVGYIGPNGAGKSTTLKMLTGILAPTAGLVRVCGLTPVSQRTRLARHIGVVFGHRSQLWWDLPLSESFDLLRYVYRVPAGEHGARLRRLRSMLDLDGFLDTPVRQLSLGQRMRGELTAALLHGPRVLFLDEPTIGLDVLSKQAVRSFLVELIAAGDTALILTTHDLADIQRMCRRLVVIDHGHIVHDGTIAALHARYGSRRRMVVQLDDALPVVPSLPDVEVESVEADGRRLTFSLNGPRVGELIAHLAEAGTVRDISILEPDIEDVITKLYTTSAVTRG